MSRVEREPPPPPALPWAVVTGRGEVVARCRSFRLALALRSGAAGVELDGWREWRIEGDPGAHGLPRSSSSG